MFSVLGKNMGGNKMKKWYLRNGTEITSKQAEEIQQKNGELLEAIYRGEKDFSEAKNFVWIFGEEVEERERKFMNRKS